MAKRAGTGGGTYLYAVVGGSEERTLGPLGLYNSDVYTIGDGNGVAAVVSDLPEGGKLRPERRHLSAHQAVLRRLVEESNVVLPVSFGTVAESAESIRRMVARYQSELMEQIRRVEGKVEMEIRASWEVSNVFEYFVNSHAELREARDRIFGSGREPSRDEKIELGQLFERLLSDEREALTKKVEKALGPHCFEIKRNKPRNEQEIMRLSCLVEKGREKEFEAAIVEASKGFDDSLVFEHSGPYPPYNFVSVRLKI